MLLTLLIRENCYRFVALGFEVIRLFRPEDEGFGYEVGEESKGWKQGKLYGAKLTDQGDVLKDVLTIIVQFYNGRMRYKEREVGMRSATSEIIHGDKGKGKQKAVVEEVVREEVIREEAIQEEMGREEMGQGKLVRRHSVC